LQVKAGVRQAAKMPPVDPEVLASIVMILFGVVTVLRRQRLGENAVHRRRFWEAKEIDAGESAFDYGVLGWVFIVVGVLALLARLIA